jgi:hypothetical protein
MRTVHLIQLLVDWVQFRCHIPDLSLTETLNRVLRSRRVIVLRKRVIEQRQK